MSGAIPPKVQLVILAFQLITLGYQLYSLVKFKARSKKILKEGDEMLKDLAVLQRAEYMRHRTSFSDWDRSWLEN